MQHLPSDGAFPSPDYDLAQLVVAPLTGRLIGLDASQFVIAEWTDPGAPPGPPRPIAPYHVHHADDEAWYILEGVLAFRLGDREVEAAAGTAVFAPRGIPHAYWNARSTPARYLLIMTPNIRRLIEELHLPTNREPAATQATYRRHDSDVLP
jgi:mannose-6-phosphate isomerase-like protein (cupin superfamily)